VLHVLWRGERGRNRQLLVFYDPDRWHTKAGVPEGKTKVAAAWKGPLHNGRKVAAFGDDDFRALVFLAGDDGSLHLVTEHLDWCGWVHAISGSARYIPVNTFSKLFFVTKSTMFL